ncbi:MAG: hypothetical protein JWN37_96 [Candidatus Nomurabacteria bacterium]|nr:hypothetical protein [Candidatus Nomurabacteria bacterium]
MESKSLWEKTKEEVFKGSKEKIQEDLERVDFDLLRTIFEEIYKKAGLDEKDMEFVKKEDIKYFYDAFYFAATAGIEPIVDKSTGEKMGERSALHFNPANFKFITPILNEKLRKRLITLKLLIHEQVHTTQFSGYEDFEEKDGTSISAEVSGLTSNDENFNRTRVAFNEGLVEKIADKVLEEYLRRSGNSSMIEEGYYRTYDIGRMLIDILIHKIHVYSGVPEDQVFNALVRASYDGQDILDDGLFKDGGEEIRSFIEEHQNIALASVHVPGSNEISLAEKKNLINIFSKELDIATYTDTHVLKFLKKKIK